jgi:hypothetical protein
VLLQEAAEEELEVSPSTYHPQRMSRGLNVRKVASEHHGLVAHSSAHAAVRRLTKVNHTVVKANNTAKGGRRTAYMPVYGDVLTYTCASGYRVRMRAGDVLTDDPTRFTYQCRSSGDIETTSPSGMHSPECAPVTCPIPPSGPEASLFYNTGNHGDWDTVRCDAGQRIVGGGCNANAHPWRMQRSSPDGSDGWRCGGSGAPKTIWAICSSRITPEIITHEGGDWSTLTCPTGKKIISGGCDARTHPSVMEMNGPVDDNAWQCGGSGSHKTVTAVCSDQIEAGIHRVDGGDWTEVQCPGGQKVIGGGCQAHGHPWIFQYNGPEGENKWKCGGHGGPKRVWALCVSINDAPPQFPNLAHHDTFKRTFGQTVPMLCGEGYSLDGTPSGQVAFEESCTASSQFTHDNQCTDIDWCLISRCGDHGTCVDGATGYTCICEAGYQVTVLDGHLESCEQIDECTTMSGTMLCGGRSTEDGTCTDGTLNYTCTCATGFENVRLDDGRDSCVRVTCSTPGPMYELHLAEKDCQPSGSWLGTRSVESCSEVTKEAGCHWFAHVSRGDGNCKCCNSGFTTNDDRNFDLYVNLDPEALPTRPHSSTPSAGTKLSYEATAHYICDQGYSLDGTAAGGADFTVTCQADKTFGGFEVCEPVDCGSLPSVTDATANATSLKFGEIARYDCHDDHTLSGQANGPTGFDVGCTSGGSLTDMYECQLISCGVPSAPPNAGVASEEVHVRGTAEIECVEGYTLDGAAGSAASFSVRCHNNGSFTGMQTCVRVSCGEPVKVQNSQMPVDTYSYMDQFDVLCHSGYTVDHTPTGSDTFMVSCEAAGTYSGLGSCLPVSCGTPEGTTESDYNGGELFLMETANFTCKPGYSTNGNKVGQDWYIKTCQASGTLGRPSPGLCIDIDYCATNPCGANGQCTDSGAGIPAPGYSCSCLEGYEVTDRPDGGQTCSADDCAGSPCGSGGTCTDLSAQGGPQGAYQCNCEAGYEISEPEPGRSTCVRSSCGPLPMNIQDVERDERTESPIIAVSTYTGRVSYSTMTGAPILKSFDSAVYTCADGYSTDGLLGEQSKTFGLSCLAGGTFSRVLQPSLECQPVQCANYQNMRMPNSHILNQRSAYVYGQAIQYECATGYTIDGRVGGVASYQVPCRADGTFPDRQDSCVAITCPVPSKSNAGPDARGSVQFGRTITYNCLSGYELGGNGSTTFTGTCEASGEVTFAFGLANCEAVSCGTVDPVTNADILVAGGRGMYEPMPSGWEGTYGGPTVRVACAEGMTLGGVAGGAAWYTLSCTADKAYSATASGICQTIRYTVGGLLTDAQSASIRLSGSAVTVRSVSGTTVLATATSGSDGVYWVHLPIGTWTFTVAKDGYITANRNITISGYTSTGGAADMSLSQVLGEGEWRAVVEWAANSRDIDSHTYWNNNAAHVYWARRAVQDHSSGIHIVLDRDDTNGYGPETTSFAGIGTCTVTSQCLVKFEIDNYSDEDGCLGQSAVKVKLYRGNRLDAEYDAPECIGCPPRGTHWTVFTLDAREGHESVYAGKKRLPPYLERYGQVDWSQTFDTQMWNMVPVNQLLTGFRAQALSNGGGRAEDAPVYTHLSLFDSTLAHSNLAGTGPDGGAEELRFAGIGHAGDRTLDLVITVTSGSYERANTNGFSGQFGKINMRGCRTADVDFTIVDAATGNPVTIAEFDITFFDFDDWSRHRNKEMMVISGYEEMITQPEPYYTVTTQRDGSVRIEADVNAVPNPRDPMSLSSEQMQASIAYKFRMRSSFHATIGSECRNRRSSGGRNLMFSFDSSMTPPDPGYQTGLQYVHQIQYAKTVSVGGLPGRTMMDCQQVDFDLTTVSWAECPAGYFLDGLYRTGSRHSEGDGPEQITRGSCCKAADMGTEYGACSEVDIFREANVMYECPTTSDGKPTAVTAIHRGAMHETLDDLDKMRCCAFAPMDLLPDGETCPEPAPASSGRPA